MRSHLRIGRLLGVPIGVNIWVFAIAAVLAFSLATLSLPSIAPGHPDSAYWFAAVLGVFGFLGSLVTHELGHSWVAQRNDVQVVEITLWLFGGVAKLEGDADDPGSEFRIALAGPFMSLVTGLVVAGAAWVTDRLGGSAVLVALLIWLAVINGILAVSNLLPAFPLDGGRILRAMLWRRMGAKIPATHVAALWGQILAVALAVVGLWVALNPSVYSGLWLIAIGIFLFVAARSQWKSSEPQPHVLETTVGEVSRALPSALGSGATVADVEQALLQHPLAPLVPLIDDRGTLSAMASHTGVGRIPPAQRRVVPATSISEPIMSLPKVNPDDSVQAVLDRLGTGVAWWALVPASDGTIRALLSTDLDRVLETARG